MVFVQAAMGELSRHTIHVTVLLRDAAIYVVHGQAAIDVTIGHALCPLNVTLDVRRGAISVFFPLRGR